MWILMFSWRSLSGVSSKRLLIKCPFLSSVVLSMRSNDLLITWTFSAWGSLSSLLHLAQYHISLCERQIQLLHAAIPGLDNSVASVPSPTCFSPWIPSALTSFLPISSCIRCSRTFEIHTRKSLIGRNFCFGLLPTGAGALAGHPGRSAPGQNLSLLTCPDSGFLLIWCLEDGRTKTSHIPSWRWSYCWMCNRVCFSWLRTSCWTPPPSPTCSDWPPASAAWWQATTVLFQTDS